MTEPAGEVALPESGSQPRPQPAVVFPTLAGGPPVAGRARISRAGTFLVAIGIILVGTAFLVMAYLYYNAYHALYNFKSDNLLGAVENYLGSSGLVLVAVGWTADRSSTLRALGLGGLPTRSGLGSIGIVLAILGVATVVGVLLFGAYVDTSVYFGRPVDCCTFDQVANEDVVSAFGIVLIAFGWLVSHLTTLRRLEGAT